MTIYSPAPCPTLANFKELAPFIDICIANKTEALQLGQSENLKQSIKNIRSLGVRKLIVTLGGEGFGFIADNSEDLKIVPIKNKVNVIDTTGAGDSFVGALCYAIDSDKFKTLEESAILASSIASLSVTKKGTQKSYSSKIDSNF